MVLKSVKWLDEMLVGFMSSLKVAVIAVFLARFSRAASLLMLPYLGWVSFAAWLNYKVVQLNGPFG